MKLNQIINLHKGLTPFVVCGLMVFYDNFSTPAWIYLSLHGTYGILWLLICKILVATLQIRATEILGGQIQILEAGAGGAVEHQHWPIGSVQVVQEP